MIGLLLYVTYIMRPNTAKALSKLLEFLYDPLSLHNAAAY